MTEKLNIPNAKEFYIFEEDRLKSFKTWPYDDKTTCNIKKVCLLIFEIE